VPTAGRADYAAVRCQLSLLVNCVLLPLSDVQLRTVGEANEQLTEEFLFETSERTLICTILGPV
jgi:hypothetical protein